jgi:hypothetical protein
VSWVEERKWPFWDSEKRDLARYLTGHMDPAEERVERMLEEASSSSPEIAAVVRRAAKLFYRATRYINEAAVAAMRETGEFDVASGTQPPAQMTDGRVSFNFDEAERVLRECVEELERLISSELLESDEDHLS